MDRRAPRSAARTLLEALACGLALLSAGCGRGAAQAPARPQAALAPPVEALPARTGALPLEERLSGLVRAANQVEVRAELEASVVAVLVESGDSVQQGQVLVRLDDEELRQQLRQAQATVRLEESGVLVARARAAELAAQVRRTRKLASDGLVSPLEVEVQEAQLSAAEAAIAQGLARVDLAKAVAEERRAALARAVVRAPVAGRVGRRQVEVGTLVTPSTLLFELGDLRRVIVDVPLTAEMLGYLEVGQPALISARALGSEPLRASVARISPFLGAGSLSTTAELDVDNPEGRLYPGMFVTVDVLYGESQEATLVPTSALYEDPFSGARGVYVVEYGGPAEGHALSEQGYPVALRSIELIAEGRGTVALGGVAPGEWVVTIGQHLLGRSGAARVRPTTWERVLDLQGRHREDLLREFLAEQQRLARANGAAPPDSEAFVGEVAPVPSRTPAASVPAGSVAPLRRDDG